MDYADTLGSSLAIAQYDIAASGASGVAQAFELHIGEDICQSTVAIIRDTAGVEKVPAGCQDYVANFNGHDLVFLGEIYCIGRTELLTCLARTFLEVGAIDIVNDRVLGHGLREGGIDCLAVTETCFKFIVDYFLWAFFPAYTAAGAVSSFNVPGMLIDRYREVADVSIHFLDFGICQHGDVGVIAHIHHFGRQDTGRAVKGGEGLIKLSHMPTDGWFALHQIYREASICNFKRGLYASNTSTDDQRGRMNGYFQRSQWFVMNHAGNTARNDRLGFLGGGNFVSMNPGVLFADGNQFAKVRIQIRTFTGIAECFFVQVRRAGCHHDPGQFLFFDILLDLSLIHISEPTRL